MLGFIRMLALVVVSSSCLIAGEGTKGNLWSNSYEDDLANAKLSPNGSHVLVYHEDTLLCLDGSNGKRLWSKTYKNVEEHQHRVTQFPKVGEAIIPGNNSLVWVDIATGKELASVPIVGEMSDISYRPAAANTDYDTLQPIVYGDLLIVWYSDGTQVIDMIGRKVVYQSSDDPSVLKIERWFSTMMLDTESDTTLFVDGTSRAVVYKHDNEEFPISTDVYQRFFEHKDLLVVITENNMIVVDKKKAAKIGTLLISAENTENYIPIVKDDKLYVIVSKEDNHEMYDVESQKKLWTIPRKSMDGILDNTTITSDGSLLLQWFDEEHDLFLSRLNFSSGAITWTTRLVTQEGAYEAGHVKPNNTLATIASYAAATMLNTLSRGSSYSARLPYTVGPGGILLANGRPMMSTIDLANLGNETMAGLVNKKINKKRATSAMTKIIGVDGENIHLVCMGEAHQAWSGTPSSKMDGEGLITINSANGKVVKFLNQVLYADQEKEKFNLYQHGETIETSTGLLVIGARVVVHASNKGELSRLSFNTEDLKMLDSRPTYAVVYCEDAAGHHQQWYIDCSQHQLTKKLMFYSEDLCAGVTRDTTDFRKSIVLFDGAVRAYQPLSDLPKASDKPVWTLTEADIDKMEIGSFDADSVVGTRHGIRMHGEHVFFLGDDGLAVVDESTGACRKHREWDADFKMKRDGVVLVKNAAVYQFDSEAGMIGLRSGCDVSLVGKESVNHSKGQVLADKATGLMVIVNQEEGTINAYKVQ